MNRVDILIRFNDVLDMVGEGKRDGKSDFQVFGLFIGFTVGRFFKDVRLVLLWEIGVFNFLVLWCI